MGAGMQDLIYKTNAIQQLFLGCTFFEKGETERCGNGCGDPYRVFQGCQVDEEDTIFELVQYSASCLDCQAGLAAAAGSQQGQQMAVILCKSGPDFGHLVHPSDERGGLHR